MTRHRGLAVHPLTVSPRMEVRRAFVVTKSHLCSSLDLGTVAALQAATRG